MKIPRTLSMIVAATIALAAPMGASAQQGDQAGEAQPPPPPSMQIPPAPVLSPDEAIASFVIKDGFRIEIAACEPLVEDPVAMAFDATGRMWVVEMRGYMPDVDGANEDAPIGRIVILTDDDGDGRMDTSTVFLDKLVLPRAVAPVFDGALVIVPPELRFYRDADGDGSADGSVVLATGFGGIKSPEHAGNGLLPAMDNWIHCSQHPARFRFDGERVETQTTPGHGQWGIAMDDVGRVYYTTNSDPLRGDYFSLHYASRNPHQGRVLGVNERIADDMNVWPIRVTPGVNRGYRAETLRDDGRLATFTSACGPVIYRGAAFGADFEGNAFVCEPAAHLVKRYVLTDGKAGPTAEPAYERSEFLASTDERFRPVNLANGPDGALYVVDLYRGILQHRIFMTTYLRKQVLDRGLDAPIGLGRIYRIVRSDAPAPPRVDLAAATDADLVGRLENANGWWRDTAQRLLVERRATDVTSDLRRVAESAPRPVSRLHALWTLEGTRELTFDDVRRAAGDDDAHVRAAAARLCEAWLDEPPAISLLAMLADDPSPLVRGQAAFSLGESEAPRAAGLMRRLLTRRADEPQIRAAVLSGLAGRELAFLTALLADGAWSSPAAGRAEVVSNLAGALLDARSAAAVIGLLELAASRDVATAWQGQAILEAVARAQRAGSAEPRPLEIPCEPRGWADLLTSSDERLRERARTVDHHLTWPDRGSGDAVAAGPAPLTEAQRQLYETGRGLYQTACGTCHQASGRGLGSLAPPLVGTPAVLGSEDALIRILLHGMMGPVVVDGREYNAAMPLCAYRKDEQIAAILTYVRRSWGNDATPVSPEQVARVKEETRGRRMPWTAKELWGE